MAITHDHVSRTVQAYLVAHPGYRDELAQVTDLLEAGVDISTRSEWRGHATAGAVLIDKCGQVLLVRHKALGLWLLPGGHLEPGDVSLLGAARRELGEETGIDLSRVSSGTGPIHIGVHQIPANPVTRANRATGISTSGSCSGPTATWAKACCRRRK